MNYFDYQSSQTRTDSSPEEHREILNFCEDVTIEVEEDHTVTVDDVRKYIRRMHERSADKEPGNVVPIRVA